MTSAYGPASANNAGSFTDGYTLPSRNGEQIQTAFIDNLVYQKCTAGNVQGHAQLDTETQAEEHLWATIQPGYICVSEKQRSHNYRFSVAGETAAPVVACAQCLSEYDNADFAFAGIARSANRVSYDDIKNGPTRDENFTITIGGLVTLYNNSNDTIRCGDPIEWTFFDDSDGPKHPKNAKNAGPRRIVVRKVQSANTSRVFGTAKSYAARGQHFDALVGFGAA